MRGRRAEMTSYIGSSLPPTLEPAPGVAQCNYELLGAFARYVASASLRLRYTLAAGTLLGALRNEPAGLLQWEHDVDVYMPAVDASALLSRLARDCGARWRARWCTTLEYRGLVDRAGGGCCGFGFKLFHRRSAVCELDVLVLAAAAALKLAGADVEHTNTSPRGGKTKMVRY